MSGIRIVESNDDVQIPEIGAPETFLRDNYEWTTFADTGIKLEDLPEPLTWRVLVLPKQPKTKSTGGILIAAQAQDAEQHLNYIGEVVAIGPLAGKNEKFENPDWALWHSEKALAPGDRTFPNEPEKYLWDVKVGDWIIYGKYSGQHITFRETRFVTINDDEVVQKIKTPDGFRVWI